MVECLSCGLAPVRFGIALNHISVELREPLLFQKLEDRLFQLEQRELQLELLSQLPPTWYVCRQTTRY